MALPVAQDNTEPGAPPGSIQLISRAAQILRALEHEPLGLSLSAIAQRTGLPRSTIHRLLAALEVERFVTAATPSGHMRLGPEILRLAASGQPDLQQLVRPAMQQLFDELDETIDLAVFDGDHLRFVDQIPAPHRLRAVSAVGATFPLHCTANGKAVLALLSDDEITTLLPAKLPRHTPATIVTRAALLRELADVRQDGVAFDREEHSVGISAAGFAFRDAAGRYAAVTVPMPTHRMAGREKAIRRRLALAARDIAKAGNDR